MNAGRIIERKRLQCVFVIHALIMTESVRLAKRLAEILACSRREAELYIEGGWVSVDDAVVETPGSRVAPGQRIVLAADANLELAGPVTVLWHQPADVETATEEGNHAEAARRAIVAASQSAEDVSGMVLLQRHLRGSRMLLPLVDGGSGLAVFSQDERIVRKLLEDANKIEQEYVVEVGGEPVRNGLALLNHGLSWNGKPLPPGKVSWQNETRLRFALKGVQPGQIRGMCAQVGLTVTAMRRIRIGRVSMGRLLPDTWRYLLPDERF